jgi:3'(2'), 5'-bisphosphate nucleotidase
MEEATVDNLCWLAIKAALLAGGEILEVYKNNNFEVEFKSDNSPLTLADRKAHETISSILKVTDMPLLSEESIEVPFILRKRWNLYWLVDPLDGTKEFIKRNGEFTVNIALIKAGKPIMGVIYAPVLSQLYLACNNIAYTIAKIPVIDDIEQLIEHVHQNKVKLPLKTNRKNFVIVASRSHLSPQTKKFIKEIEINESNTKLVSVGSSLKFCLIAEGKADVYPRFGPTMEWDTAAGQAIVEAAGGSVVQINENKDLFYNKENLLNPWFIVKN